MLSNILATNIIRKRLTRAVYTCMAVTLMLCHATVVAGEMVMQSNNTTHLSANAFRAISVAYENFETKLRTYTNESSKLARHLAQFENYTIEVAEHEVDYVITFNSILFEGRQLKGGGSEYVVRKDTMTIEKRQDFR